MALNNGPLKDDPRSYIAEARRRALSEGRDIPDTVTGSGLFADISGFTPLTEGLANALGPRRGAEELVANLNRILAALIDDLHRFGGEVIYFSGDAITCWLDGDDGRRAASCALQMQQTMNDIGRVEIAPDNVVELSLKVAAAVGSARRFVVGDPGLQRIDVLAGSLIDDLASAEQVAEKGDVVLDQSCVEALGGSAVLAQTRRLDAAEYGILESLAEPALPGDALDGLEDLDESVAREWLLPTVYERLSSGGGAMFAELRTVFPIFIRFGGIDFDDDPDAPAKLKTFVRAVQHILDGFGGNLLQLTLGDKGAYLYGVFGSPKAHEDDARRAVRAAIEIRESVAGSDVTDPQIGVSRGRVLSGTCGHPFRRTFACLGDPVNLAARLMSKADPGAILVTEHVAEAAGTRFLWEPSEPLKLKGKAQTVNASRLKGIDADSRPTFARFPLPLVGRRAELETINAMLTRAEAGHRSVVGITAEPGIGKSRLVAEVVERIRAGGTRLAFGEAESMGTSTSYLIWRNVWRELLDIPDNATVAEVTERLETIDPRLVPRAPLLGAVLGLDLPDNGVTALFDPKLRKTSLESLLSSTLRRLAASPIVFVLEDCHWIDEASVDLLEVLVRDTAHLPILFVVAYRDEIPPPIHHRFSELPTFHEMKLEEFSDEEMREAIGAKLDQQFGTEVQAASTVIDLVIQRSEGNPFFIEELITFLHRVGVDISDPASVRDIDIPESLQAIVLERVDALDPEPRRTLKVGSVVGGEFEGSTIPKVYPDLGTASVITAYLEVLGSAELIARDQEADDWWLFRHAVTRDVSYESIPYRLRSQLHQAVGEYLELRDHDGVDVDRLAYHFWHSEDLVKKIEYQRRAADAARASYSNAAAIEYLERLLSLVELKERGSVLTKLGDVLELVGEWNRAEDAHREALTLAAAEGDHDRVAWATAALAEIARKQGRYDDATIMLEESERVFDEIGDEAGKGRVLHLVGTLSAQRGDLETARHAYQESLAIRRQLGDLAGSASLLSNLGVVAEYTGDLDEASRFHEEALAARTSLGDKWAIAVSNTNLGTIAEMSGDFERARDLFNTAMQLNAEVGDAWMVAVSHNNLGNAYRDLGQVEQARHHFAESARQYLNYGDRWATAFLLEDVAQLAALDKNSAVAFVLLGAADQMREEIDAPPSESREAELRQSIMETSTLPMREADGHHRSGTKLGFRKALEAALDFLLNG